ncbi:MAG: hypothetical protein JWM80_3492 [Cyanobacteria bacterium RYN_339]|nr:hypothetical protein [Cyanobacteria bacterium RYN_339]
MKHPILWSLALVALFAGPAMAKTRAEAERDINATYKVTQGSLSAEQRAKLQAAELAWIKFKDADVEFHRAWHGAAAAEARYLDMTREREVYLALAHNFTARLHQETETFTSDRPYAAADKALNNAYGKLVTKLDATSRKKLLAAQLAWIAFRDAEAGFWKSWPREVMGKNSPHAVCMSTVTELRTMEFEKLNR